MEMVMESNSKHSNPTIYLVPVKERTKKKNQRQESLPYMEILRTEWKMLVFLLFFGLVLSFLLFLFQPRVYVSRATLLPEYASTVGYASNVLNSRVSTILNPISTSTYRGRTDAVRIDLYPALMTSDLVIYNILHNPLDDLLQFDGASSQGTVFDYMQSIERSGFFSSLFSLANSFKQGNHDLQFSADLQRGLSNQLQLFQLSKEERKVMDHIKKSVRANFNMDTGAIQLETRLPDPVAAALLNRIIIRATHDIIVEYQKEKYKLDYEFLKSELETAKQNMEVERTELAKFIDENSNTYSADQQAILFQMEYDFTIANTIYRSYLFQVEESRLKSEEETPLFTYLHPIEIPNSADLSGFTRMALTILFIYLLVISARIFYIKKLLTNRKPNYGS